MLSNLNPVWGSRGQRKRDNKEKAKQQGLETYRGGGYTIDKRWNKEEQDKDGNLQRIGFLKKLKLASFEPLERMNLEERQYCPKCKKSCKFYCYQCIIPIGPHSGSFPKLQLPVDVTIISHPKEKKSKSSSIPQMVIAPDNIKLISTADAPVIRQPEDSYDSVVLLFPGEYAKEMTDLSEAELKAIKKVVIIDSTWNQTRRYMYSENIRDLKMVKI